MTITGPNYAGAVGTNGYTNPSNAVGSDEATCAGPNNGTTLVTGFWDTFGFAIHANSTIDGILVELKDSRNSDPGAAGDVNADIGKDESALGAAIAESAATIQACGAGQDIHSFGGSTNLWGLSWTAADINSASFTVRVRKSVLGGECGHLLNWIRVTVYYSGTDKKSITTKGSMSGNTKSMILSRSRMK